MHCRYCILRSVRILSLGFMPYLVPQPLLSFYFCSYDFYYVHSCREALCARCSWGALEITILINDKHNIAVTDKLLAWPSHAYPFVSGFYTRVSGLFLFQFTLTLTEVASLWSVTLSLAFKTCYHTNVKQTNKQTNKKSKTTKHVYRRKQKINRKTETRTKLIKKKKKKPAHWRENKHKDKKDDYDDAETPLMTMMFNNITSLFFFQCE